MTQELCTAEDGWVRVLKLTQLSKEENETVAVSLHGPTDVIIALS